MSLTRLLSPACLSKELEPYKLLLAVLLRKNCVSISVSNPYLSLAEPVGAVVLRDGGKVPLGALKRLLRPHAGELAGVVLGCEHMTHAQVMASTGQLSTLQQVEGVLHDVAPGLPGTWWEKWTPASQLSSRIDPEPGADKLQSGLTSQAALTEKPVATNAAMTKAAESQPAMGQAQGVCAAVESTQVDEKVPVCSVGTLFLQHYLDGLGSQNTFG